MIIKVKVKPGAREEKIERLDDGSYIVSVRERAEKGKANMGLIRILCKEFKVSGKNIIIKNPSSRKKIIDIN